MSSSKIVSILHSQFHKENEMKPQTFFNIMKTLKL
jgi:hypothetical protein